MSCFYKVWTYGISIMKFEIHDKVCGCLAPQEAVYKKVGQFLLVQMDIRNRKKGTSWCFLGIFCRKPARIPGWKLQEKKLTDYWGQLEEVVDKLFPSMLSNSLQLMMPCTRHATKPEGRFRVLAVQHDGVSIVLAVSQVFRNNTGSLMDTL